MSAAASGLLAAGCIVDEQCSGDAECGAGSICIEGDCRTGCRLARDCPAGQSCVANQCIDDTPDADADVDADQDDDGDADIDVTCPDDMVEIRGFCIDVYEASRDDATESSAGVNDASSARSVAGVRPWSNMSRETAAAACAAAGKRLCTHDEWIRTCRGPDDTEYPYGDTYEPTTCNGIDTYGRGNQHLMPTGSFAGCTNEYGVFDISGNVWEIDEDSPGWVHGGAYNCIDSQSLHLCSWNEDFGTDPRSNVGFRCCSDGV